MTATTDAGQVSAKARYDAGRLELARLAAGDGETKREIWTRIARIAARVLQVNRVGYWVTIDSGQAIRCEHLYQASPLAALEGVILRRRDFPGYFAALEAQRVIAVEDVATDANAAEFREAYFQPLGITSMLDSPVYRNGEIIGIVCHEQVGPRRAWTPEECDFAVSVAEATGRLCAESDSSEARRSLERMRSQFDSLETMAALGRLAAGVAHDFRNVLGTAMGYKELLEIEAQGHPGILQRLGEIGKALDLGHALARDLGEFGQVDPARPRVLDLAEFLSEFKGLLSMAAGQDVRLELVLARDVCPVFMDRTHLERALLNLVINARDAMGGAGVVTLALGRGEDTGPGAATASGAPGGAATYAVLEVRDTGQGMSPEVRGRIFEPFFSTKGEKGTGLGLPIVWRTVTRAGGTVEVDSAPGRGSVFRLRLPGIADPLGTGSSPPGPAAP